MVAAKAGRALTSPSRSSQTNRSVEKTTPGAYHDMRTYPVMMMVGVAVVAIAGVTTAAIALTSGGLPAYALVPLFITLLSLFFVIWLGGRSTDVTIDEGILNLRLGDMRHTFDLRGDGTTIEVHGSPEAGDWSMTIVRRGLSPVHLDNQSVEPIAFMEALAHWRRDTADE